MEGYVQELNKIRVFYQKNKAEHFPIENDRLKKLDEYNKELYIKVLCSIALYAEEISEMQTMFLQRLIAGCDCKEKIEDYMRKALDIKIEDFDEFIEQYKDNELKYRFCIDGIILVGIHTPSQDKQLEFLSEIIELLKVSPDEMVYLGKVARAIIEESSELFNKAQENKIEQIKNELFFDYIKTFYVGLYRDEYNEKYYYASKLSYLEIIPEDCNKTNIVTFENLIISMDQNWSFEGNEKVIFKNCHIEGNNDYYFKFNMTGRVEFQGCRLEGFKNRVAYLDSVNCLVIINSIFNGNGYTCDGDERGGLFKIDGQELKQVCFIESQFLNCYIAARTYRYNYGVTGVIIDANYKRVELLEVKGCKFVGCQCQNNGNYTEMLISGIYATNSMIEENEYIGVLQRLVE